MSETTFDPLFNPEHVSDPTTTNLTYGITLMAGRFAPMSVRLATNSGSQVTAVDQVAKYSLIHEFGHAAQSTFMDHTGKWIVLDSLRLECYNLRNSGTPCLSDYAFNNVIYNSSTGEFEPAPGHTEADADVGGAEFFAELFAAWYCETYGVIDSATMAGSGTRNDGTRHNAEFAAEVDDIMNKLMRVFQGDFNLAWLELEEG